jgi:hypothetical protein
MAETYSFGDAEEEKWLTWSVERLLEIVQEHGVALRSGPSENGTEERGQENQAEEVRLVLADLDLPEWVTKTDLGAPLEALGAFYARQGKVESVRFSFSLTLRCSLFFYSVSRCHSTCKPSPYLFLIHLGRLHPRKIAVEVRSLTTRPRSSTY